MSDLQCSDTIIVNPLMMYVPNTTCALPNDFAALLMQPFHGFTTAVGVLHIGLLRSNMM